MHISHVYIADKVSDRYDLLVIGGGSGGLACSKEGNNMMQHSQSQKELL